MATIEDEAVIDRPVEVVWSILEDVRRMPELSASTVEVRDAPVRLTAPGQGFTQVVRVLGRRFESRWVVTGLDPGRSLRLEGDVGYGVRYQLEETVEALDGDRCRFSLEITYVLPLGVLGKLAGRLGVEHRARTEATDVVRGLKAVAESEPW